MPLTADAVRERLAKMGNTNLSLLPEDIELDFDQGINLPLSAINALRRDAAEAFEDSSRPFDEIRYIPSAKALQKKHTTAQFFSEKAYLAALKADERAIEAFDIRFIPLFSSPEGLARANGVFLPPVVFDSEMDEVADALKTAKKQGIMYALVGNLAQIKLALDLGLVPIGDFRLNITNRESALAYEKMGVCSAVLSPELTLPQIRDIGGASSAIVYGRLPLMLTEKCVSRELGSCDSCESGLLKLTDRRGFDFPVIKRYLHRSAIFNSLPTYMADKRDELSSSNVSFEHFIFTVESKSDIINVIDSYKRSKPFNGTCRRIKLI
jgi:putative protease